MRPRLLVGAGDCELDAVADLATRAQQWPGHDLDVVATAVSGGWWSAYGHMTAGRDR